MTQPLVFGDIDIIVQQIDSIPHIIEGGHRCDCPYCSLGEEYKCSKCGYKTDDQDYFWNSKTQDRRCPGCGEKLIFEHEIESMKSVKRKCYLSPVTT